METQESIILVINGQKVVDRQKALQVLEARDGWRCTYPGCFDPLDDDPDERHAPTIDHKYPQSRARDEGWTMEEIWNLDNLQIMGRRCNAKKADLIYNEDGTLPRKGRIRNIKSERPQICSACNSGRLLSYGETCEVCGSDPQPKSWPNWAKVEPKECDHSLFWCWLCGSGIAPRVPASATAFGVPEGEEE